MNVTVKLYTTGEGGRQAPANSGYAPTVEVLYSSLPAFSCQLSTAGRFELGVDTLGTMRALCPELIHGEVLPGDLFHVKEGPRVVGEGRIVAV